MTVVEMQARWAVKVFTGKCFVSSVLLPIVMKRIYCKLDLLFFASVKERTRKEQNI